MEDYIISIFGTILSIIFFLITYRQTIGARKERIKSANNEIVSILIRRIVLENITPSVDDISRLIEGKARDSKIKSTYLLSEQQILNTIYTRIYETDFINQQQRNIVLGNILPVLIKSEERPLDEEVFISSNFSKQYKNIFPVILALLTSILGVTTSVFTISDFKTADTKESIIYFIISILVSFIVLIFLILIRRYKDDSGEENKQSSVEKYIDFETEVLKSIKSAGLKSSIPHQVNMPYDFLIEINDRKIIVEAKVWSRRVPNQLMKRVIHKLSTAVEKENATEAILVSKYPIQTYDELDMANIKVFSLKEFRNYLINLKSA
jgi:hypothetical protein